MLSKTLKNTLCSKAFNPSLFLNYFFHIFLPISRGSFATQFTGHPDSSIRHATTNLVHNMDTKLSTSYSQIHVPLNCFVNSLFWSSIIKSSPLELRHALGNILHFMNSYCMYAFMWLGAHKAFPKDICKWRRINFKDIPIFEFKFFLLGIV